MSDGRVPPPDRVRERVAWRFAARERLTERFGDRARRSRPADPDCPRYGACEVMGLVAGRADVPRADDGPRPDADDVRDALGWVGTAHRDLERLEEDLVRLARTPAPGRAALAWGEIADALELASAQAAQQRYARRGVVFAADRPGARGRGPSRPPAVDPPYDDEVPAGASDWR
jgi:hypothetical protein